MRKMMMGFIVLFILVGCGSSAQIDFAVEKAPKYKDGEAYPIIIEATEEGEAVADLDIVATLEMEKMDHGIIEVVLSDAGDGMYEGEVELPMAGEWIADVIAKQDGNSYEKILTFNVKEG